MRQRFLTLCIAYKERITTNWRSCLRHARHVLPRCLPSQASRPCRETRSPTNAA
jgi:hypothetical protein